MGPKMLAAVVLAVVFVVGAFAGIVVHGHLGAPLHQDLLSAADQHEAAMAELRDLLDLDDAQMERIHGIMAEHQHTVQAMWEQLRPELQTAMQEVHTEIAELLGPEQRARFHDWLMQQRERHLAQRPD